MKAARRLILGTLIAAFAVLAVVSGGGNVGAQNNQGGLDDWGSKAAFEEFCGLIGGGFIDSPADNMTICVYPNGDREVCDQNGGNCTVFPKSIRPGSKGGVLAGIKVTPINSDAVFVVDTPPTKTVVVKSAAERAAESTLLERDE